MENKFYKVEQHGGSFITATFYNPVTQEERHEVVRDYDDDRSMYNPLYDVSINEEAKWFWNRKRGVIQPGDTVRVVRGRKYPVGTEFKVHSVYPYYDKYQRFIANYAYFVGGGKCSTSNLTIIA